MGFFFRRGGEREGKGKGKGRERMGEGMGEGKERRKERRKEYREYSSHLHKGLMTSAGHKVRNGTLAFSGAVYRNIRCYDT